jgi:hypothetical protein
MDYETRNMAIDVIASIILPYHRHGANDTAYDALHIELADISTNTLQALATALQSIRNVA